MLEPNLCLRYKQTKKKSQDISVKTLSKNNIIEQKEGVSQAATQFTISMFTIQPKKTKTVNGPFLMSVLKLGNGV